MVAVAGPEDNAEQRARAVADAWSATADPAEERTVFRTASGLEVWLGRIDANGAAINIWLAPYTARPPDYAIENPPTMVEDPSGEMTARGRAYRLDPLQAVAEVIAAQGGAMGLKRARR